MSDDWPQIKARLEADVAMCDSDPIGSDIRAALQRVNDLDNACMVHHDEYAALRQRVEELERYNIEHTKLMYAARCRAEAAEAKLVNSEEGHRWLEAQLREAEAKLAKVVELHQRGVNPQGQEFCTHCVRIGWPCATLAAAKGE